MASKIVETIKRARRVGTPLIAAASLDQWTLLSEIRAANNGKPLFRHDALGGLVALNDAGHAALVTIGSEGAIMDQTRQPAEMLLFAERLPGESCIVAMSFAGFLAHDQGPLVPAGVSRLREPFKADGRCLLMLDRAFTLPASIQGDVLLLTEDPPTQEEIGAILASTIEAAEEKWGPLPALAEDAREQAVQAGLGLSAFAVETTYALSLFEDRGLDLDEVWDRKATTVNQTRGLHFSRPKGPKFADVRGLRAVREFLGVLKPKVVVFWDEFEKSLEGTQAGTGSSTGADRVGVTLSEMEAHNAKGVILFGVPGGGKSLTALATAAEVGACLLTFDPGNTEERWVGASQENIRAAFQTIWSIGGSEGDVLFIATANTLHSVPSALRRRFRYGIWMVDLPTDGDRVELWNLYLTKQHLSLTLPRPLDTDWTGAEIATCCELAASRHTDLLSAAKFVLPVAKSGAEQIREARDLAKGRFFDANTGELYDPTKRASVTGRAFSKEA